MNNDDLITQARAEWAKIPHAPDCHSNFWDAAEGGPRLSLPCNCFRSTSVIPQVIDALEADAKRLDWLFDLKDGSASRQQIEDILMHTDCPVSARKMIDEMMEA